MKRKITKQERNQIIQYIKLGDDNSALNIILSKGNTSYEEGLEFLNRLKKLYDTLRINEAEFGNSTSGNNPQAFPGADISGSSKSGRFSLTLTILIFIITLIITIIIIFI